jgi:hypothetical protein
MAGLLDRIKGGSSTEGGLLDRLWSDYIEGQRDRPTASEMPAGTPGRFANIVARPDSPSGLPPWMTNLAGSFIGPSRGFPPTIGVATPPVSPALNPVLVPASVPISRPRPVMEATTPQAPMPVSSQFPQSTGMLDRVGNGIQDNSNLLMALGSGIMQGGWGKGLEAASAAASAERKERQQDLARNTTFQALLAHGVPEAEARAAMSSPEILRALVNRVFASRRPET